MKRLSFIILLLVTFNLSAQHYFSKQEVLSDINYLKKSLIETHYNLYTYTTKEAFDDNFEKIKSSITEDSLTELAVTSLFQAVISKVNNGHTEIPFPGKLYREYAYSEGTLFPLEIAFENYKPLVRKNWSSEKAIKIGAELVSINDQPISLILEEIYPLISAERRYFKHAKIELFSFPRLYWQAFGQTDTFSVEIKEGDSIKSFSIKAVDVIEGYEMKRNDISTPNMMMNFYGQSAYLKPGNFGGDFNKYKNYIDSSFSVINQAKTQNLIIDLRNNLGGDDAFSDYLVSFIADKPFYWNAEFSLKTSKILKEHVRANYDTTKNFWQGVLIHNDGEIYPYEFEPYKAVSTDKRFKGKVYVLVNRQSHSQSAVTAAQIQDYGFATVVGEETAEFPSLYASQYQYSLPKTGIEVKVSKGYIVRVSGSKKAEGVIPDIYIKDYLLDEKDEVLEGVLHHINNPQN
ncbi:S41 family peptidase [Marivirga salinae]|uniref:S41 family peptidase n=1 Tax=Marivirga salinarum TaxID=3059078 RepID=A0AA51ND78_9BACT|nr:S41 family peptidase [Marivirga sp. BDSF4-3]WMN11455.1 S41 family peptidase [Marivirga sp. BDSF4-3]